MGNQILRAERVRIELVIEGGITYEFELEQVDNLTAGPELAVELGYELDTVSRQSPAGFHMETFSTGGATIEFKAHGKLVKSERRTTPSPRQRLTELIVALYKIHSVGGPLHVVLDDRNLDGRITPYYDSYGAEELDELWCDGWRLAELPPEAPAVVDGLGRSMRQLCDEIAALLNAMPEAERLAAVEHAAGFIR